ncbi:ABC transporter ATP-binding protein [Polynucleobacter sp. AM-26B4]|uniref:ABC transporter ATP-binding protein n=1 Tax=Polynucleobacter sp. AM-26B4 TaxID=2689103 RepID=UPI001C0E36BF|nr:ABC transporter ATP-binding protein [Polynucleobacter sp. AM-26B4]MBU3585181.1 ABC transporter ATP-binding protein [Polynucleobacter sp. AM-26B4]
MFSEIVIKVENLSKCYQIYDQPHDRLKQFILPRLQDMAGMPFKQYFREFWALKDVSFEVKKGETIGIIGRNGSGKSTLLQMICGTLNPTGGSIQIQGRIAALLELGSGFNPEFTGRENIYLNASILGLSADELADSLNLIIEFADIGDFLDQPIKTYSSGMVIRLAFSVAIYSNPNIFIIDEALAVGDFIFQQKCYKKLKEMQDQGVTIILVSHDFSSIVQFCKSTYVVKDGELVFGGTSKDAVNFYKKLYSCFTDLLEKPEDLPIKVFDIDALMCSQYQISKNLINYGDVKAEIYDWGILDRDSNVAQIIFSESTYEIVIRIKFNKDCHNPIIGYFFTDRQGREIVGTNTEYLKKSVGTRKAGEKLEIRFKQRFGLTSGEYSFNIGCSEYIGGVLIAHHRLYNLLNIHVTSDLLGVGFFVPETLLEVSSIQ